MNELKGRKYARENEFTKWEGNDEGRRARDEGRRRSRGGGGRRKDKNTRARTSLLSRKEMTKDEG